MKTFKNYLNESKQIDDAANVVFNALLKGGINKATNISNYLGHVLSDHSLKPSDKNKLIKKVKSMGYTGNLLDSEVN